MRWQWFVFVFVHLVHCEIQSEAAVSLTESLPTDAVSTPRDSVPLLSNVMDATENTNIDDLFKSIDKHVNDAREGWDKILEENHLPKETRLALLATDNALVDANATYTVTESVVQKATEEQSEGEKEVASARKAAQSSLQVVEDGTSLQEDAEEARRWVDKLLEKVKQVTEDSKASHENAEAARVAAEDTEARDATMLSSVKNLLTQSERAVHEATQSRELLQKLETEQQLFQTEAEKARIAMAEAQREEQQLRQKDSQLEQQLSEAMSTNTKVQTALEQLRAEQKQLQQQLTEQQTAAAQANAKALELQQEKAQLQVELATKEKLLSDEHSEAQHREEEQRKVTEEALASARQARETTEQSLARQKEMEEKTEKLEKALESVRLQMHNKLEIARQRTKEWLRQQTTEFMSKEEKDQLEINRLKAEIERLEREERLIREQQKQREEITAEAIKKQTAEEVKRQLLLQRATKAQPMPSALVPDTTALQMEESVQVPEKQMSPNKAALPVAAAATQKKSSDKSSDSFLKQTLYQKMMESHDHLQKLLESQSQPSSLGLALPPVDLERDTTTSVLKRRKSSESGISGRLPFGYPPPPSTARMQQQLSDVNALEIDSGNNGYGDPIIAQGTDDPLQSSKLTAAHRDNCIKICSGGDETVYRDGVVSTVPDEQSKNHTTGACMKMCALFSIDADCPAQ